MCRGMECVGGDWGRGGEKNFSNFDSLGHLGKQVGVKKVAIVIEFVKFGCEKMREKELRAGDFEWE